jgi:hypothetical protein
MFKIGKYSQEGKEVRKRLREMRRAGEALVAVTLRRHGLGQKIPVQLRRRRHVKRVLAKEAVKGEKTE